MRLKEKPDQNLVLVLGRRSKELYSVLDLLAARPFAKE